MFSGFRLIITIFTTDVTTIIYQVCEYIFNVTPNGKYFDKRTYKNNTKTYGTICSSDNCYNNKYISYIFTLKEYFTFLRI